LPSGSCRVRPEPRSACVRPAWGGTPRADGNAKAGIHNSRTRGCPDA
jgi:hypothetical protein